MTYWDQLGYGTTLLERALEQTEEPDVDALLRAFEATSSACATLESEAARVDPRARGVRALSAIPERVGEAEQLRRARDGRRRAAAGPRSRASRARRSKWAPSNQLAVHAADAVVAEPGQEVQPARHLRRAAAWAKTHLLHALGNALVGAGGGAVRSRA